MQIPRVLIVDDEAPITALLEQALEQDGMRVAHARDGIECMNKVASFRPDVIVMDIMMPKLDGVDTTQLIRRNRSYADTIIIALSARADEETRQRMEQAGANLFMRKPFAVAKLLERVRQLLASRSQLR
jgi:DNA-binding response OmpR family regulator